MSAESKLLLLSAIFNVSRAGSSEKKKWCVKEIKTDGVGASVIRTRSKTEAELAREKAFEKTEKAKKKKTEEELARERVAAAVASRGASGFRRVIGVDDGKKAVATAAELPPDDDDRTARHSVTRISGREYRHEMGFGMRAEKTAKWTEKSSGVVAFNSTALSPKTASLERYEACAAAFFAAVPALEALYVDQRKFRRLRFDAYVRGQKGLERMATKLLKPATTHRASDGRPRKLRQPGEEKDVLVGWENANFNGVRGCAPAGPGRLKRVVMRRATVVDVPAYRNSKACSCCLREMKGLPLNDLRGAREIHVMNEQDPSKPPIKNIASDDKPLLDSRGRRVRSYGVRLCETTECVRTLWDRDVNAAINNRIKLMLMLSGQPIDSKRKIRKLHAGTQKPYQSLPSVPEAPVGS
jgi:hypothetical protein